MKTIYTPKLIINISAKLHPMESMKMEYTANKIFTAGHTDKNITMHTV